MIEFWENGEDIFNKFWKNCGKLSENIKKISCKFCWNFDKNCKIMEKLYKNFKETGKICKISRKV